MIRQLLTMAADERLVQGAGVPDWPERLRQLSRQARDPRLKAFYKAGTVSGDTPLSESPLMALDFETTGLNPEGNGIVSIGMMPFSLRRIRMGESRHWVVRPREKLDSDSVVIHGITHGDILNAPDLNQVLSAFLSAMAGHIMVVHHRGIERPFLDAALRERLGEGIEFPVIDTMELEARLHRRKPPGFFARLRGHRPVSIRLDNSRSRYHLPFYSPHHALTDALASAELLQAQVAHHFSPDTPVREFWR
ncbi:MAG: 3'-5' exonuclease [Oleiphilaceae bacterium]|nr:3'-5' exonuclease [Oleiphilaceae bacterium]